MGQIVLYNVAFSSTPPGVTNINVYYRKEGAIGYSKFGQFPAYPTGVFVTPVTIPGLDDDAWYIVRVEMDCAPCFAEKRMYSSNLTTVQDCCAPQIIRAYVQVIGAADIT